MTNQTSMLLADAAPATLAPGTRVTFGRDAAVTGTVLRLEVEAYAEPFYLVARADGQGVATLKRSEVTVAPTHDRATMYTTCPCGGCVEMRRNAGRAWASL